MRSAEDWARAQGCLEMASDALINNEGSLRAHEALGFEIVDRCSLPQPMHRNGSLRGSACLRSQRRDSNSAIAPTAVGFQVDLHDWPRSGIAIACATLSDVLQRRPDWSTSTNNRMDI